MIDPSTWTDDELAAHLRESVEPTFQALMDVDSTEPKAQLLVAGTFRAAAAVFLEIAQRLERGAT